MEEKKEIDTLETRISNSEKIIEEHDEKLLEIQQKRKKHEKRINELLDKFDNIREQLLLKYGKL